MYEKLWSILCEGPKIELVCTYLEKPTSSDRRLSAVDDGNRVTAVT